MLNHVFYDATDSYFVLFIHVLNPHSLRLIWLLLTWQRIITLTPLTTLWVVEKKTLKKPTSSQTTYQDITVVHFVLWLLKQLSMPPCTRIKVKVKVGVIPPEAQGA